MNVPRTALALLWLAISTCSGAAPVKSDPWRDDVQRRSFQFFWNEAHPETGLVKDRAGNFKADDYNVGSIAATGFGLSALPIGVERGWVKREAARKRALVTLRSFDTHIEHLHGLYPHFLYWHTRKRAWNSEFSTIDTALLLAGAVTAGEYFGGEVRALSDRLVRRVDWRYWSPRDWISHGSRPEQDTHLPYDYGNYCEAMLLYALAIGSPEKSLSPDAWYKVRLPAGRYGPYSTVHGSSLFVNQYQNLWLDLKDKNDGRVDYFDLMRVNTLTNRRFCIDQSSKYRNFGPNEWGLTAGDGPDGYQAWGALPGYSNVNGTINPHAAGGSFEATPDLSRRALLHIQKTYGSRVYGRYGYSDGYNVTRQWYGTDVVGIDTGATLLALENHRTGLVKRLFMRSEVAKSAFRKIGLRPNPPRSASLRVAPMITVAHGSRPGRYEVTHRAVFRPNASLRRAWKNQSLFFYGGLAEGPVTIRLNGTRLGSWIQKPGESAPAAFEVPASRLNWDTVNILQVTVEATKDGVTTYGPVFLGPKASVDFQPLAVKVIPTGG